MNANRIRLRRTKVDRMMCVFDSSLLWKNARDDSVYEGDAENCEILSRTMK